MQPMQQFLEQNKKAILSVWVERIFQSYKPEMVRFLEKEKNQFANPVRHTIITCTEKIYDGLKNHIEMDEKFPGLEDLIKLRAVQEFLPSEALFFIFSLKEIIGNIMLKDSSVNDLIAFERKMDDLTRLAFNIYTNSRNKIYEIRLSEIKAQSRRMFDHNNDQ